MIMFGFGPGLSVVRIVSHPLYVTLTVFVGWGILSA